MGVSEDGRAEAEEGLKWKTRVVEKSFCSRSTLEKAS